MIFRNVQQLYKHLAIIKIEALSYEMDFHEQGKQKIKLLWPQNFKDISTHKQVALAEKKKSVNKSWQKVHSMAKR